MFLAIVIHSIHIDYIDSSNTIFVTDDFSWVSLSEACTFQIVMQWLRCNGKRYANDEINWLKRWDKDFEIVWISIDKKYNTIRRRTNKQKKVGTLAKYKYKYE